MRSRLCTRPTRLELAAQQATLTPGMQAQVGIFTGRRSALRYLVDPLIDSSRHAL